jgi:Kef-type K+ transport system membrane component KefB/nucleotide-binding universal stress UspA family protein
VPEVIPPIPARAILLLLVQLCALLLLARALAELMRRVGQPAVLGELGAGLLLGPTLLGRFAPNLFAAVFPQEAAQFHLLEVVSWLGMVLLLLLTGIETDVRAVKNLGRAALMASVFGMVVPFASGLALGWALPDAFLTDPANRPLFAAFVATAMAISAMPVIAKILIDLDLMRRNVGMVILSAAVVDDTTGWLVLSVIAGVATGGVFRASQLAATVLWLCLFLAAMRWLAYPAAARAMRYVNERAELAGGDLTLILGFTFLAAAATEAIGVHAAFGAFVAGMVVRQIRRVQTTSLHTLEMFVMSALSPIFFAYVGLKVDLWSLTGWQLPAAVIGVAIAGKVVGCYAGGRLGRLSRWESLALGFGMNARGAMGLIVASIGLALGLLTQEMYSTLVLVAVVTSFMAPLLLRWALPHLTVSEEERRRMSDTEGLGLLPARAVRILVPTAGGENAMGAIRLAAPLARRYRGQVVALYVEGAADAKTEGGRPSAKRSPAPGDNLDAHLREAAAVVGANGAFSSRSVVGPDVARAVIVEAGRDFDLVMIGAAPDAPLHDPLMQRVIRLAPVHVVIVRSAEREPPPSSPRLLVPVDGSLFSRYAAELAFAYAGAAQGVVTLLHVVAESRLASGSFPMPDRRSGRALPHEEAADLEHQLQEEFGALAARHQVGFRARIITGGSPSEIIIAESRSGYHDLLVMGAENKLLGRPLFYGQGTAEILERAECTTAVVVPRVD